VNISFDITPLQEEAALAILAKRQETDPGLTIENLFKKEALYALGLTRAQLAEKKKQETKDKLETLSEADLEDVKNYIESKPQPTQLPA
jgi:hypothetical protein